jgi:hypothetical protein
MRSTRDPVNVFARLGDMPVTVKQLQEVTNPPDNGVVVFEYGIFSGTDKPLAPITGLRRHL